MSDGLITASIDDEEKKIDSNLRPSLLNEYIGQEKIKENLKILIPAFHFLKLKKRRELLKNNK